jgi:ribosomal-protein-alanine N-acetyltransferase
MNAEVFDFMPRLQTNRLEFRQMGTDDADLLFRFNSDPEALAYVPRAPFTEISQAEQKLAESLDGYQNRTSIWWVFRLTETGERIGYGGLFGINHEHNSAEIGYGLLPPYWGQGYAGESVERIVSFGFGSLELHRIYGLVVPGNTASEKILENLDFAREGVLRDNQFARGRYFDMAVYARINPV